jgi:superfamily II DNA or RNA helicase
VLVKGTIVIHRTPAVCKIRDTVPAAILDEIHEACSYEIEGHEHMARSGRFGKNWDGKKKLFHRSFKTFGSGLSHRVSGILTAHGYEVKWDNDFATPDSYEVGEVANFNGYEARNYQEAAVQAARDNQQGMIKIPTGGGKTYVAARIIADRAHYTAFLVHTKDLLYQAKSVFTAIFGPAYIGQIGDGVINPRLITVMTIQTAARALDEKYEKESSAEDEDSWYDHETKLNITTKGDVRGVIENAGLVFMDECHRVAAPTASAVVSAFTSAVYRYGLSASPWRDDGADLALEAIFGHVIYDIKASTLIEQGHLVKPLIRFRRVPPMKFPKGTKYATIYDEYIVNNDVRNAIVVDEAVRRIKRGTPTLVLVRRIDHGRVLAERIGNALGSPVAFLSGKDDSELRSQIIDDLRNERRNALVATTIADEGLDIKPLTALILAGGGKSSTRALQRVGRVLRPFGSKTHAEVVDFEDNAKFLLDHSHRRLKIYESEPDFQIMDL